MRYIFIINPMAGKRNYNLRYENSLNAYLKDKKLDYKIYISRNENDIRIIAKNEVESHQSIRIYVIGGDGSLFELVNATKDYNNVEIGLFPSGSGNDFIKNFKDVDFFNIEKQLYAKSKTVNLIDTHLGTSINIASIGFDAGVCFNTIDLKKIPFSTNTLRYYLAIMIMLFTSYGSNVKGKIYDNNNNIIEFNDNYLLLFAANGQYYGGGYNAAPNANINDDILEIMLIKTPSIFKILSLLSEYKKGNHINNPKFTKYLTYIRGIKIEFESDKMVYCNLDGECHKVNKGYFNLSNNTIRFIVPK